MLETIKTSKEKDWSAYYTELLVPVTYLVLNSLEAILIVDIGKNLTAELGKFAFMLVFGYLYILTLASGRIYEASTFSHFQR